MSIDFENVETIEENTNEILGENPTEREIESYIPKIGSPEWTPYILGLLTENEKVEGYPKVNGLRRIVPIVLGEIVKSVPVDVQSHVVVIANNPRIISIVNYEITILGSEGLSVFGGVADAGEHNVEYPYNKYSAAIAETRAEGRALRKALQLDVIVAEEMDETASKAMADNKPASEGYINNNQKNSINILCNRLNLNAREFINLTLEKVYDSIGEVQYDEAAILVKKLTEYQRDKSLIPEQIVGFTQRFE